MGGQGSVDYFSLPVSLRVTRCAKQQLGTHFGLQGLPKVTKELDIPVRHYRPR